MNERPSLPRTGAGPASVGGPRGGGGFHREEVDVSTHESWVRAVKPEEHLARLGTKALVDHADELGQLLSRDLATSQIRQVLTRVNALSNRFVQEFDPSEVPLLKVRLAYAAARATKGMKPLAKVLLPAVDRIHDEADFRWFARFVEAIVAYHRYHGGRD